MQSYNKAGFVLINTVINGPNHLCRFEEMNNSLIISKKRKHMNLCSGSSTIFSLSLLPLIYLA